MGGTLGKASSRNSSSKTYEDPLCLPGCEEKWGSPWFWETNKKTRKNECKRHCKSVRNIRRYDAKRKEIEDADKIQFKIQFDDVERREKEKASKMRFNKQFGKTKRKTKNTRQ